MIIEDLLWRPGLEAFASKPDMDALTEADSLTEAQLLDVRIVARTSTVGLLFETRQAQQIREGNTAVLIAHGVRACSWKADRIPRGSYARTVFVDDPSTATGRLSLSIGMGAKYGARLALDADAAAFFIGEVPGLHEAPPDYGQDEATIRAQLPDWQSQVLILRATFLE